MEFKKFNKYEVGYLLQYPNIGTKYLLERIYNPVFKGFGIDSGKLKQFRNSLESKDIKLVGIYEEIYPKLLKQIYDPPLVLFCKGNTELLGTNMVTIVGTRSMSAYGKWCTQYIVKALEGMNLTVVSGLAMGIDAQVHLNSLECNLGSLSVVAGGIDKGFPKSNIDIYDQLCSRGIVISEYPPGREVVKGMFPMRNRILAGLGLITVVIESGESGGSLITARLALEDARDIYCIPRDIDRFASQGCNALLSQGAIPLYNTDLLIEDLSKRINIGY